MESVCLQRNKTARNCFVNITLYADDEAPLAETEYEFQYNTVFTNLIEYIYLKI